MSLKPSSTRTPIAQVPWLPPLLFVVVLVALVEVLARAGLLTAYVTPPSIVVQALVAGLANGDIAGPLLVTLRTFVEGLAIAGVLGVVVGIAMGMIPLVNDLLTDLVDLLRPIPSVAMIPLAILFLGIGGQMRVAIAAYAAFWPLLVNTLYGVRAVDPTALDTARNFGIPFGTTLFGIVFPASLVQVWTGLRVSASIALVVTVTAELVGGDGGLGYYIGQMEQANRLPQMYAAIVLTGILGYLVNAGFLIAERRIVFWAPQSRELAR